MFLQTVNKGQKVAIDVLGQVATIGLILSQGGQGFTEATEHMKRIKLSAEIVSTTGRDNKILFSGIPLFNIMALVNIGEAFVQQKTEGARDLIFCNVPICMDGAIQSDKSTYVKFTVDATAENLSEGSVVHVYSIGSSLIGTEPIRIIENTFRPKEQTHLSLTGATSLIYENGVIEEARYKSVAGTEILLTDPEYPFFTNVMGDLFVATMDENRTTKTINGWCVMPCKTLVNVHIKATDVSAIPVFVYYDKWSNSQIEGCHC